MSLLVLLLAIVLLIVLIGIFKWGPFLALLVVSIGTGLSLGLSPEQLLAALEKGVGNTLGGLGLLLPLGAMLGALLSDTGAIGQISAGLLRGFGLRRLPLAMATTGLVVGLALFYNAGFILLLPLVFAVTRQTGASLMQTGLPLAAALSVTHGFLPPHPGPATIAKLLDADQGQVLALGFMVALPAIAVAGLWLPYWLRNLTVVPPAHLFPATAATRESPPPPFGLSLLIALLPILLMGSAAVLELGQFALPLQIKAILVLVANPSMALLLAILVGLLVLVPRAQWAEQMAGLAKSVESIAAILVIIAAGGAFKQVLDASGLAQELGLVLARLPLPPLAVGWLMATIIRIALGSATVAATTAAGLVAPLLQDGQTSPELMVLAIGAGSLMCSHVNDTGFWLFKESFGLTLGQTFRSWTVMESLVGIIGLLGVLVLSCW